MTEFPNFGLINQMSKHIANNASPKILDYQTSESRGYTYSPSSTDLITQSMSNNSISQQQRFNAIADQLIYSNNALNGGNMNNNAIYPATYDRNTEQRIMRQGSVIDSLIEPQQLNYTNSVRNVDMLNNTASQGRINDTPEKKESFMNEIVPDVKVKDPQSRLNIIGVIIICFVLFMLIQLYLSQKKLEFMISIYKSSPSQLSPSQISPSYGNQQRSSLSFSPNEVF